MFPCAWLWCELEATQDVPWNGKTRLIGIEPNTTWPANGLQDAQRRDARLLSLVPGSHHEAWIRIKVTRSLAQVES
jgi:hypothetical protein